LWIRRASFRSGFVEGAVNGNAAREKNILTASLFHEGAGIFCPGNVGVKIFFQRMARLAMHGGKIKQPFRSQISELQWLPDIAFNKFALVRQGS